MLGLACEDDTLHFTFQYIADKAKGLEATKRNVLSLLASLLVCQNDVPPRETSPAAKSEEKRMFSQDASLFDPLGMVSSVTVGMKVLFQEICNSKFDWGEVLTGEIKIKKMGQAAARFGRK